jgi:molecular chaperone GrpE
MTMPDEQDLSQERSPPELSGGDEPDVQSLQAALGAAEARAAESKDLYLRALAELENVRKRAVRDIEQAHKYGLDRIANELVGVKDSLELGLASEANAEALRAGTEATLKLLAKALENAGLVDISPKGERFNPELHEAVIAQPTAEHEPDTVIQVIQKGYQLNGRLLRPARVIVSREP